MNRAQLLPLSMIILLILPHARGDALDNWTTVQVFTNTDPYNPYVFDSITYGNGVYVASAETYDLGEVFSSTDGLNWTLRASSHDVGIGWGTSLNYMNGRFVGVGGYATVAISTNGTNWSVSSPAYFYGQFGDATYAAGRYVVVGENSGGQGIIMGSTDGITWKTNYTATSGGLISSVAYSPGAGLVSATFLAIGDNDGNSYTSPNGITWTKRSIPGGSVASYGNGLFIVPLNNGTNLISLDGVAWSAQNTGLTNQLGRASYVNGLFMAFAGSYLATSIDGTNWFQYPNQIPGGGTGYSGLGNYYSTFATDGFHLVTAWSPPPSFSGIGFASKSGPLVDVSMTNAHSVKFSGLVGRNYQLQSADSLSSGVNDWRTNTSFQLTNTPIIWTDSTATNNVQFYRGVLLP